MEREKKRTDLIGDIRSISKSRAVFIDAQEMHRLHPKTFDVPDDEELAEIQAGDLVKVAVEFDGGPGGPGGERFWVSVTQAYGDDIWGTCADLLCFPDRHGVNFETRLHFEKRHCYDVDFRTTIQATRVDFPVCYPVDKSGELRWKINRNQYGINLSFSLEEENYPSFDCDDDEDFDEFRQQMNLLLLEDERLRTAGIHQLGLVADKRGIHLLIRTWDAIYEGGASDILFPNIESFLAFQEDFRRKVVGRIALGQVIASTSAPASTGVRP